jgi:hypothetical protein
MLVYGDHHERAASATFARGIKRDLDAVERMECGLARHARLVGALVNGGRLLQGIADAVFAEADRDRQTRATQTIGAFLTDLARAACRSWDSGFRDVGELPRLAPHQDWPAEVELREPEGFAFYAVYPEAYAEAARRLKLVRPPRVIGIRSIGTSLAAVVAAALDAPPPVTIRPFGDPSDRKINVDGALERDLLHGEAHYVIIDEGPGQSGSSFGAVADWLQQRGVPGENIAVLPSHPASPGPAASDERRRWWGSVQRQVADFGDAWPALIERWCTSLLGHLDEAPQDISGGAWRKLRYAREEDWPATVPAWERRKFLVSAGGERLLVKFAGLGSVGDEKLAVARRLYSERFAAEPVGLAHGFLIERWCGGAVPLGPEEKPLAEVARYIASRARLLPAVSGSGASVEDLLAMVRRNVSLEMGDDAAHALAPRNGRARDLERRIVRVRTDNKLDRHEWLRTAEGALIKTDALDHHRAHDLIGCQDVAWDAAAAIVEFDLDQPQSEQLVRRIGEFGPRIDAELLEFYRVAYSGFRVGHARLGAAMTSDAAERRRINRRGDRYAAELQHLLESSRAATRPRSPVGGTPERTGWGTKRRANRLMKKMRQVVETP